MPSIVELLLSKINMLSLRKKCFCFFISFFFLLSFTFRYPLVSDRTMVQLLDPGTIIHSREFGSWYRAIPTFQGTYHRR